MRLLLLIVMMSGLPAIAFASDPNAGHAVFHSNCSVCHSAEEGTNKIGPSLAGVYGRTSGSVADYAYSGAMKNAHRQWDQEALQAFLANPRATVPGTRMAFPGLHQPGQISDVIAYLRTLR